MCDVVSKSNGERDREVCLCVCGIDLEIERDSLR
jgi:hypothetical protein